MCCRCRRWLYRLASFCTLFTPLAIEPDSIVVRAVCAFAAVDVFFKLVDYDRSNRTTDRRNRSLKQLILFLVPFPPLNIRFNDQPQRDRVEPSAFLSIAAGGVATLLAVLVIYLLADSSWLRRSFLLDHTAKFVLFAFVWDVGGRTMKAVERAAGYTTPPVTNAAYRAISVADFWRRLNCRVHHWLVRNVYLPAGGRDHPVRGVFAVFTVSALFHEVAAAVVTSQVTGYQFLFFLSQSFAIVAMPSFSNRSRNRQFKSRPTARYCQRGATVAWFWLTSMLFFHTVNLVFPYFYVADSWLP